MDRCYSPLALFFCLLLTVSTVGVVASFADQQTAPKDGLEFLTLINDDLAAGLITAEEALLYRLQYGFSPAELPLRYRVADFSPLRCATTLIDEYYRERPRLSKETVDRIDAWLLPDTGKQQYISSSGRFALAYETDGTDAVPAGDIAPPNGIPDFVENVAAYFDESWAVEVVELGFTAPPLDDGTYRISFESMQYYGYTSAVDGDTGETRIVMHNTYIGFPDNDDPQGNIAGAAKVTAAHELKHATQYAATRWAEGGWSELDATWAEELVYDQTNDYYNYLTGESPMRHPELPLDSGAGTTGSYEDCVWQIWLSETWGTEIIQDFWTRRGSMPSESVMATYGSVLLDRGISLTEGWASFTAWNYGVGERTVPGLGYEEGAAYPIGPVVDTAVMYPFNTAGQVEHLAAEFVRLEGFSKTSDELLHVVFDGQDDLGPLTLAIHVAKRDGTGLVEIVVLNEDNDADHLLSVPVRDVLTAGAIVGNAATIGFAGTWSLDLELIPIPAIPAATLDRETLSQTLTVGAQGQELVRLTNTGEVGSLLEFTALMWTMHPDSGLVTMAGSGAGDKSVAGSTLTSPTTSYLPGELANLSFTLHNGSSDDEWLTDLSLDFPAGVAVAVTSDFVGGSLGDLISDNALGDGAQVSWHGSYGPQNYGVVRSGEYAFGTVQVMIAPTFSGDLEINWFLAGDNYGGTPHQINSTIVLNEDSPVLQLQSPVTGDVFAVGDSMSVLWSTGGQVPAVDLDLSRDGGASWSTMLTEVPNNGAHMIALTGPPANNCLLRIRASGGGAEDISNGSFHIYASPVWVHGTPVVGSLIDNQYQDITLDLDTTGMIPGSYQAWLVVLHNAPGTRTVVPVSLNVEIDMSSVPSPPVFAVHGVYPNPFNPRTTINFELPGTATTIVDVLDVRGHLVRRVFQGELAAGGHSQMWDGLDGDGRATSAGVYLIRVRAGSHSGTVKTILAK